MKNLKILDLSFNNIKDEAKMKRIEQIHLEKCSLINSNYISLILQKNNIQNLKILNLGSNDLGDSTIEKIAENDLF